jgi:hypothetical protein
MLAWRLAGHSGPRSDTAGYTRHARTPASTTASRLYESAVSTIVTANSPVGSMRPYPSLGLRHSAQQRHPRRAIRTTTMTYFRRGE